VSTGKLIPLAVGEKARTKLMPNVPTLIELGYKDLDVSAWMGLLGPRGLPADIVRTINSNFNEVLKMPDIAARMAQLGIEPIGGDPSVLARQITTDDETFGRLIKEFGLTHETAAQAVGRSRSAASNLLRLLNLADPVQTMLMAGDLDMGHARALLSLDKANQISAASQIAAKKMSVREAESLVKKLGAEFSLKAVKPTREKSRDIKRVEEELSDLFAAQVEIKVKKRIKRSGRITEMGELSIQFGSLDELNGLIERLSPNVAR
jgi:hypothetical protein